MALADVDDAVFRDVPKETAAFVGLAHGQPNLAWRRKNGQIDFSLLFS
jgi:hypothetical protein